MEQYRISKHKTVIVLLISFLLHFVLLTLILWQSIIQWDKNPLLINQTDDETYVAQQLLSAGQQPATVLFQDDVFSGYESSSTSEQDTSQNPEQIEQLFEEKTHAPSEEDRADVEPLAEKTIAEPAPTQLTTEQPKATQKPRINQQKAKLKRTANKKNITMADISRGFMRSIQQEAGHNTASRNMQELSLQMYSSKIWNLIKNAFLACDTNLHLPEAVSAHTQLVLTIGRSGKLLDIHLNYPKHIAALRNIERLLISRAHQAGLFPPLPVNIKGASKTFSFPLYIQGQAGFHSYSLGYR